MRRFLEALVIARAKDPDKLVSRIRGKIAEFEDRAGVSAATRGKTRATSAFGLLYAACAFGAANGALPKGWDCMEACLEGYRNYQFCLPDQTPLATRLLTIAQRPETLDLRPKKIRRLSDAEMAAHGAFIKLGKSERVELLLMDAVRQDYFPDWKALKQTSEFKATNVAAKDHDTTQRQVRQGKEKERFFCFVLPPGLVEQLRSIT